MALKQDWILKQIDMIIQFVARLVFNKDSATYEIKQSTNLSQTDLIYENLSILLKDGKIGEAEDLLFDNMDENNINFLELSLDFYKKLNSLTDTYLEENDFSREEVENGLRDVLKKFNIPTVGL